MVFSQKESFLCHFYFKKGSKKMNSLANLIKKKQFLKKNIIEKMKS
jgi:hypothetical protein